MPVERIRIPICWFCQYFDNESAKQSIFIHKCKAFPEHIPSEIWSMETLHTKPYPNDNSLVFERATDAQLLDRLVIKTLKYSESSLHEFDTWLEIYLKSLEKRIELIKKYENDDTNFP
jgi:hypothetical protein